jgi:hypothetical protein
MDSETPQILFTPEGRQEMIKRLKPLNLLDGEHCFLDPDKGCIISDIDTLNILQQREQEKMKEALALNDKAEALLDKMLQLHIKGNYSLQYTPSIDLWCALKKAREASGRQLQS